MANSIAGDFTASSWDTITSTGGTSGISGFADGYVTIDSLSLGDWATVDTVPAKPKRKTIFGRGSNTGDPEIVLKLVKQGLTKRQQQKYKELAEKAFEEALQYSKGGQTKVAKDLEEVMSGALKKAAIQTAGYDTIITSEQIETYRKKMPSNKQLVIDDLTEYEKPIPKDVLAKVTEAKNWKVFDSFKVFWVREVKDPIVFGQIDEEEDTYYWIAEWDKDISVNDLIKL